MSVRSDEEDYDMLEDEDREEDYEIDIPDEDLIGDLLSNKPHESDGLDSVIVVDGVPQVGPERLDKLQNVIRKIFSKFGRVVNEHYPVNEDKHTKGYLFIEYSTPDAATEAVKAANGYKMDKQHTFTINLFSDFATYENLQDDWKPPEPQPFKPKGNLHYYMFEPDACDQYSVLYEAGEKTSIMLNTQPEPVTIQDRMRWTETHTRWSPLGTYLATFHSKGIALWGGEEFKQMVRFSHPGVQVIDFSPNEKYMVSFSNAFVDQKDGEPQAIIVWDVLTGQKKRAFHADRGNLNWPVFKWSQDDKFFARLGQDSLSIYETPSFGLLDKKSIKVPFIRDFGWSPTENTLAYWVAEDKDVPARVTLIDVPSKNELRAKNLFNVADAKIYWQKAGDYLCVKVDRYSKQRKEKQEIKYSGITHNLEIFHMREKQIPVDSVEIKDPVTFFAWDPVNAKCAVIHGEAPSINVSFYDTKGSPTLLKKFEKKSCNSLFWAPCGQFIVFAGLRNTSGLFEFYDSNDYTLMNMGEHFMATDCEWDPTGRYFVTSNSFWTNKSDNAYYLWTFQGRILKRVSLSRFCQFYWRPRPPSLINAEKAKEIKKNLKKYSQQFDVKDKMKLSKASKELIEERQKLMRIYEEYRRKREREWQSMKDERTELRRCDTDTPRVEDVEEETIEYLVKSEETVLGE